MRHSRRRTFQTKTGRHVYQLGERLGLHFSHHAPAMSLYGDFTDVEFIGNLLVQQSDDDRAITSRSRGVSRV